MWVLEGKVANSNNDWFTSETCVFGVLSIDGEDSYSGDMIPLIVIIFINHLKKLQNKFHKVILFLDTRPEHYRSIIVRKYFEKNKDILRVEWFPKGSPEF